MMFNLLKLRTAYLLRRLEPFTQTDMVYAMRGTVWLTLEQGFLAVTGLAIAITFANTLSKETYGSYQFVLSMFALVSATTLPAFNTVLTRAVARGNHATFLPTYRERVRGGFIGTILLISISYYYWSISSSTIAASFLIAAMIVPFFDSLTVYSAYLNGVRDFRASALTDMAVRLFGVTCLLVAIRFTTNLPVLIGTYFAAYGIARLASFAWTYRRVRAARSGTVETSDVSFGRHLSALYTVGTFVNNIDKIILFQMSGAATVAAYSFALVIPDQLMALIKNISTTAYPKYSTRSFSEIQATLLKKSIPLCIALILITSCYVLAVPFVFSILFPRYTEAVPMTQLLSLGVIEALTLLPLAALKAHKMTDRLYRYQFTTGAIYAVCLMLGVYLGGIYGLILGALISKTFSTFYIWHILHTAKA